MQFILPPPPIERPPLGRATLWFLRLLAVIAVGCSLFLSWRSTQSGPIPGCGSSAWDCDHVVTSAWSRWFGIPVSYLGCATYAVILGGLMFLSPTIPASDVGSASQTHHRRQTLVWTLLVPMFVMAALSAIWFTYLQVVEIGRFCPYCLATHACGLIIAMLLTIGVMRFVRDTPASTSQSGGRGLWLFGLITVGVVASASMVLGQYYFPHETFVVEQYVDSIESDGDTELQRPEDTFGSPALENYGDDNVVKRDFVAGPVVAGDPDLLVAPGSESESDSVATTVLRSDTSSIADDLAGIAPADVVVDQPHLTGRQRFYFYMKADPINVYEYPILGDPNAENLIVEVVDYTCHHCREMYHYVEAAREHFGNEKMAVVVRPVALDQHCNPYVTTQLPAHQEACKYVRLALAVWSTDPDKFPEFHQWLMAPENVPDVSTASAFAAELIGADVLASAVKDTNVLGMLGKNHELWNDIGGNLPQIFAGRSLIRGMPRDNGHFIETLTKQFSRR